MTYEQFLEQVYRFYDANKHEYRLGQVYFNLLCRLRPDISELIRGSAFDTFFKERITQVVHDEVQRHW